MRGVEWEELVRHECSKHEKNVILIFLLLKYHYCLLELHLGHTSLLTIEHTGNKAKHLILFNFMRSFIKGILRYPVIALSCKRPQFVR